MRPSRPRRILRRAGLITLVVTIGVLNVLIVLAVWPIGTGDLDSRPEPAPGYDEAVERFDDLSAAERGVLDACRSRLLDHGEPTARVVVLFHGLTNCPRQFVELGEQLHERGATVLILRAPRHGLADASGEHIGGVGNVGGLTPTELRDFADDAIDIATGLGEDVDVLGLSMGGVIAAWTAQTRPEVDRAVVVAPAVSIPRGPDLLTTAYVNVFGRLPNLSLPGTANLDHAYAGESTAALVAMFRIARWVEDRAAGAPPAADEIAIVLNPNDDQVDNDDVVSKLAEPWRRQGAEVTVHTLPASPSLPHDVIDVGQPAGRPELVYPVLVDLLELSDA